MSYSHIGKAIDNGIIDYSTKINAEELIVNPNDDALHITNFNIGDFEWWYFDIIDVKSNVFLKIVLHIGTNPLKTKIYPQLALSINIDNHKESLTFPYKLSEIEADTEKCNITVKDDARIWVELVEPLKYHININTDNFKGNFEFISEIEGWKPLGDEVQHQIGKKKGGFSWVIPAPKAIVNGTFTHGNNQYSLNNAVGYHDHNYNAVDKKYPLYMDDLVTKWFWGKCYAGDLTVIFMDTFCRTNRTLSILVAENANIIHSSNNLIDCSIGKNGFDSLLKGSYPVDLHIKSKNTDFSFESDFRFTKMLDSKDLIEDVPMFLKWLIRSFIAKPVYYGIFSDVDLRLNGQDFKGFGNYEAMIFREK